MAVKATSISMLLVVLVTIFLALASEAIGGRAGPAKAAEEQPKRPDCLIDGGNVAIPGIGRVQLPGGGLGSVSDIIPSYGDAGFGFPRQYVPGQDDLPVPNPGYEVPIGSAP